MEVSALSIEVHRLYYGVGPSGYSALLELENGGISVTFERGVKNPYEFISFTIPL